MWLLVSLFWQTIPVRAQQRDRLTATFQELSNQDAMQIFKNLLQQSRGARFHELNEKIFGSEVERMAEAFDEDSERLFQAVTAREPDSRRKFAEANQRA